MPRPAIDRFAHLDSPFHRWDPRWRIAALGLLMISFALASGRGSPPDIHRDLPFTLAALAVSIALLEVARIPLGAALRALRPALVFFAFLILVMPFTQRDGSAFGPIAFSSNGLLAGITVTLRALSVLLLVFPMLGTSRFDETMNALRALRVPGPLVALTAFSYRYLFVFADQVRRLRLCWRARGFETSWSPHAARTIGNGVGMLVVGSMERSERLWRAMVARGYSGSMPRRSLEPTRASDVLKSLLVVLVGLAFVVGRAI